MTDTIDELVRRGERARRERRYEDAKRDLLEAVDGCRKNGTREDLARALRVLGEVERGLNRGGEGPIAPYQEAVAIYRDEGGASRLAHTVRHLGDVYFEAGRADLALPCFEEALTLYRREGETSPLDLANAIRSFAVLKERTGNPDEARALWTEARDLYRAAGVEAGVAESNANLVGG